MSDSDNGRIDFERIARYMPAVDYIYFIQVGSNGPIKIGRATEPNKRMRDLQSANPFELHLIQCLVDGSSRKEAALHLHFASARMRGEWFRPTEELLAYIADPFPMEIPAEMRPDLGTRHMRLAISKQGVQFIEHRCHVCRHVQRNELEMLALEGLSFSEIARRFGGFTRKNLSNHMIKHVVVFDIEEDLGEHDEKCEKRAKERSIQEAAFTQEYLNRPESDQ